MSENNTAANTNNFTHNSNNRIGRWVQHLLDLSMRNRLLNLKDCSQTIPLICSNIAETEDRLSSTAMPVVRYQPSEAEEIAPLDKISRNVTKAESIQDEQIDTDTDKHGTTNINADDSAIPLDFDSTSEQAGTSEHVSEVPHSESIAHKLKIDTKHLWTLLPEKELDKRLLKLFRQTRTDREEGGVNTLFLTIGTLCWNDKKSHGDTFLAPVILVPVELVRKSAKAPFLVVRSDEDAVINATLMELLHREFSITCPELTGDLATDEEGIDVSKIMSIFKTLISKTTPWTVNDDLWLGRFSFDKFIMYSDLNNRWDQLARNSVVKQLIELSEDESAACIETAQNGTIGVDVPDSSNSEKVNALPEETPTPWPAENYTELFIPSSADSSQRVAIQQSQQGKSFVLYGPPGTGKSQTITNLIAHNLACGKRVLFVSEKRAALEVVYNRLEKLGLAPFCLELHSNKSGKRETLDQFQQTYELGRKKDVIAEWQEICSELGTTETELNEYVSAVHKKLPCGLTIYDSFGWLLNHNLNWSNAGLSLYEGPLDGSIPLNTLRQQANSLQSHAAEFSLEILKGLAPISSFEWSPQKQEDLIQRATALQPLAEKLCQQFAVAVEKIGLPDTIPQSTRFSLAANIMEFIQSSVPALDNTLSSQFADFIPIADSFINNATILIQAKQALAGFDLTRVLCTNINELKLQVNFVNKSFFLFKSFRRKAVIKAYSNLMTDRSTLTFPILAASIDNLERYQTAYWELDKHSKKIAQAIGTSWSDPAAQPDFALLTSQIRRSIKLRKILSVKGLSTSDQKDIFNFAQSCKGDLSRDLTELYSQIQATRTRYSTALESLNQVVNIEPINYAQALLLSQAIIQSGSQLRRFSFWLQERGKAISLGLKPLAAALESGRIPANDQSIDAMEGSYRWQVIQKQLLLQPILSRFDSLSREKSIELFTQLDAKYQALAQRRIISILSNATVKAVAACAERGNPLKPEGDILRREMGKKMRHIPVRSLLEKAPHLTRALKPCFLMSPLSVSQYLPTNNDDFDLVVFDEASQIPTWDAVGVIARGKQAIVVGDPKQMPPTVFFQKQQQNTSPDISDQNEEDSVEDLESILDECIAIGMDGLYLNTHYRSRNESLIAFSNHFYYEDRLATFPSPEKRMDSRPARAYSESSNKSLLQAGVHFEYVPDGVYDRSKTRTNPQEAQRVVDIIKQRLTDSATAGKSIGVTTFSLPQKELIEDLLEQAAENFPEIDAAVSDDAENPLFVKNLESVQGDERDCMIFSIGYAPDAKGSFPMNFGPLNKIGGQRRLNVAITRAKEEIIVVSSIRPEQIDLGKTNAVGPAHLRAYLQYVQSGQPFWNNDNNNIVDKNSDESDSISSNQFADQVESFLKQNGFAVDRNVGFSDFKIDIAVIDPKNPDKYILAVECDGSVYKNTPTARDRDTLRPMLLESLGWKRCRVWSTEWFIDPQKAQTDLLRYLQGNSKR